jgi:hypothetical protein
MRKLVKECTECRYKSVCWWPSEHYEKLFWLDIIKSIK